MVYNQSHMLLAWQGTFIAGDALDIEVDQFSGGIRFIGPGVQDNQNEETLDNLIDALTTFWRSGDAWIPLRAQIHTVKWNTIDVNGRYLNRNTTTERRDLAIGGNAGMIHPLQIAWATTWTTGSRRGLASKGRTYWPTGVEIDPAQFTVTESRCELLATRSATLIDSLNSAASSGLGGDLRAAVMSNTRDGAAAIIEGARVGNRLDVQRRRAEQQTEIYQQTNLVDLEP